MKLFPYSLQQRLFWLYRESGMIMPYSAEKLYSNAIEAYERQDYRQVLHVLDRNWEAVYAFACSRQNGERLIEIRQQCRDAVIDKQTDSALVGIGAARSKNKRKSRKINRRRKP